MLGNCETPFVYLLMHFPGPFRLIKFISQIVQLDAKNLLRTLPLRLARDVDKEVGRVDIGWEL